MLEAALGSETSTVGALDSETSMVEGLGSETSMVGTSTFETSMVGTSTFETSMVGTRTVETLMVGTTTSETELPQWMSPGTQTKEPQMEHPGPLGVGTYFAARFPSLLYDKSDGARCEGT